MSKVSRWTLRTTVAVAAVFGILLLWLEIDRGKTPPIQTPDSIASLERVSLGSFPQWILIRGHHRTDPVLLVLHGGPGMPAMYLAHAFQSELERHFVVVHWDRLGAGKSFAPDLPREAMSVAREISDTLSLCDLLRQRFGLRRIYLVGHSYGSYLGMLAARAAEMQAVRRQVEGR